MSEPRNFIFEFRLMVCAKLLVWALSICPHERRAQLALSLMNGGVNAVSQPLNSFVKTLGEKNQ